MMRNVQHTRLSVDFCKRAFLRKSSSLFLIVRVEREKVITEVNYYPRLLLYSYSLHFFHYFQYPENIFPIHSQIRSSYLINNYYKYLERTI